MSYDLTPGQALRAWRKGKGFTQVQLASLLSAFRGATVYQTQISQWEADTAEMNPATKAMLTRFSEGNIDWPKGGR